MIGAMLCAMNSAIWEAPAGRSTSRLNCVLSWLCGRRASRPLPCAASITRCASASAAAWCPPPETVSSRSPLHDGDALDQLRDPLHEQQREGERDQKLGRIDRQAAGIGGLLVLQQARARRTASPDRRAQRPPGSGRTGGRSRRSSRARAWAACCSRCRCGCARWTAASRPSRAGTRRRTGSIGSRARSSRRC